ncbi:transcriptional regulator, TetR family [Caldalkalibacillus thermarum TA2.A1]|uniref:TetR/AcrR family transcriptional regulator n=1 Tax=Caldalkalibacillus thermarum (strain TA2.A1) TaxID=986075 RepID=F5L6Z9_CALTT|nr:TetR/AcrR family transcriptional regulator [Caldalkalibacillus thermarum]EGL82887.1 transcriptional regulator, TetR family [Caldalkalibacillus thermarum TA2.A1]QZT34198.1 TetR/AcrR family transcriptional regulator [Caldalkalibacillus thermarum TA2.A1]GGK25041.1 TetR family transcriptional regulator [Caldalkalibacillus thermarum]
MTHPRKKIPTLVKDQRLIQKRREQMIAAAVSLFTEKGFHKTTTREIASKAGFSIGTLYEYIQSKEDVLYLVCDAIHQELEDRLLPVLKEQATGRESLVQAIRRLFEIMDHMQDQILIIYQEAKSLPADTLRYVLKREEEITSIFEQVLKKGIEDGSIAMDPKDVKLMAHNIMVLGEMWVFRRWALAKNFTLEEYIDKQTAMILNQISYRAQAEESQIS